MRSKNALGLIIGILMTVVCATASFAQPAGTRYLGCFKDTYDRDLTGYSQQDAQLTLQSCANLCRQKGFKYAAAQYGSSCFCGNSYGKHGKTTNCGMRCAGNSNEFCSGSWANSVYDVSTGSTTPTVTTSGPTGQIGLTGVWRDENRAIYSIRQIGNQICVTWMALFIRMFSKEMDRAIR